MPGKWQVVTGISMRSDEAKCFVGDDLHPQVSVSLIWSLTRPEWMAVGLHQPTDAEEPITRTDNWWVRIEDLESNLNTFAPIDGPVQIHRMDSYTVFSAEPEAGRVSVFVPTSLVQGFLVAVEEFRA